MQFIIIEVGKHLANKALPKSWTTILQRAVIISNCGQLTKYLSIIHTHLNLRDKKRKLKKIPYAKNLTQ